MDSFVDIDDVVEKEQLRDVVGSHARVTSGYRTVIPVAPCALASTEEAPTRRSCSVQSFSYPTQNFPGFTRTPGSMTPIVKAYLVPTTTAVPTGA